ncbi:hypothetical protein Cni_G06925 [Canna indica]|uniref:RNase H type-1 domain-containing protein n=1 Tax=Canna indica TaxID=4628 RepID=A0AAQ3Q6H1_9LILI|nr:hypothetical protein Cni_G06925 [Canna indica]
MAMQKAKELELCDIRILSDCQQAVNILDKKLKPPWFLYYLSRDIWKLSEAIRCDWMYIRRNLNSIAHNLAKAGQSGRVNDELYVVNRVYSSTSSINANCKRSNVSSCLPNNCNSDNVRVFDDFNELIHTREEHISTQYAGERCKTSGSSALSSHYWVESDFT